MNITIVTSEPVADYGGLGRQTYELSEELNKIGYNIKQLVIGKRFNNSCNNRIKSNFSVNRFINT